MERWTKVKSRTKEEMQMANKIRSGDIQPHLVLFLSCESKLLGGFPPSAPHYLMDRNRCGEMLAGAEIVITFPKHTYLSFDPAM